MKRGGPLKPRGKSRRSTKSRNAYPAACERVDERSQGHCEAMCCDDCNGRVEAHHHRRLRAYDEAHATLMAICNPCHSHVHNHVAAARELGLLLPNITLEADPWTPPNERQAA